MRSSDRADIAPGAPASEVSPRVVGLGTALTLGMAVSTFIAFALGALAPFLRAEFDLSRTQLGALTAVLFAVGSLGSPTAGRIVDALGGRRTMYALFLSAAGALVVAAVAPAYVFLVLAMCIGGLAMALGNPATNKLVAASALARGQGLLMGVKQSGVQVSAFLAGALLPSGAVALGWRPTLLLSVAFPLIGVATTRLFVPPVNDLSRTEPAGDSARVWKAVGWLAVYAFLMGCGVAVIGAYLPLYSHEHLRFDVASAGLVVAVMGLIGIGSRIAWSHFADRSGRGADILALLAFLGVVSQIVIWASGTFDDRLVWLGAIGVGASAIAWNAVGMLVIVRELRMQDTGRASGIVLLGFYGGYVISPLAFGYVVDAGLGYGVAWAGITLCYAAAAVVASRRWLSLRA